MSICMICKFPHHNVQSMHYQLKEYDQEVSGICASTVHTSPAFNENYGSGLQRFERVKHSKYATVDFYLGLSHLRLDGEHLY